MMTNSAPIVLFVYNRPEHTKDTLEALASNTLADESILYIYADGAKEGANPDTIVKIEETKKVIKSKQWCKEVHIIEASNNKGLAASIVEGVTEIVNKYGRIIVLEDDIVTSPGFLRYMNDALNIYEAETKVMHIAGYIPTTEGQDKLPTTFFLRFMSCWGWATWKDRWEHFIPDANYLRNVVYDLPDFKELDYKGLYQPYLIQQLEANCTGKLKTWAIKWYLSIFIKKGLCLYPNKSLVRNIGLDGSGENSGNDSHNDVLLIQNIQVEKIDPIEESKIGDKYLRRFYKYGSKPSLKLKLLADYPGIYRFIRRIYIYFR